MATTPVTQVSAKPTNLLASIDMGTNSFKLLTVQFNPFTGKFLRLHRLKEPVVLGRQTADSELRAIEALKKFRRFLETHEIRRHKAVATAAVRDAGNQADFLRRIRDEVGFEVEVLSGEEEARLIYLGALHFLPIYEKTALVIDIGGGSTELVLGKNGKVIFGSSVKLGHVNLTQKFAKTNEIPQLRTHIRLILEQCGIVEKIREHGFEIAVGSSGTVESIERAIFFGFSSNGEFNDCALRESLRRDWRFNKEELRILVESLCVEGESSEKVRRERFFKRRSEFIVAGTVLLNEIFDMLGIEKMEVSGYALGEGVIAEILSGICLDYDFNRIVRWGSVVRLATRFLGEKKMGTAAQCASLGKVIFEGLRKCNMLVENQVKLLASLEDKDLEYVEAACVLHNIGLFDGAKGFHKQSYKIIMNGDHLHGYSSNEVKFIALLARHHRKKFPKSNHTSLQEFSTELKENFRILCAIVRVSIVVQKYRCLNNFSIQGMEFSHSHEGFKLVLIKTKDQPLLPGNMQPLPEDDESELKKELAHFETVFLQKLFILDSVADSSCSVESSQSSKQLQGMH